MTLSLALSPAWAGSCLPKCEALLLAHPALADRFPGEHPLDEAVARLVPRLRGAVEDYRAGRGPALAEMLPSVAESVDEELAARLTEEVKVIASGAREFRHTTLSACPDKVAGIALVDEEPGFTGVYYRTREGGLWPVRTVDRSMPEHHERVVRAWADIHEVLDLRRKP